MEMDGLAWVVSRGDTVVALQYTEAQGFHLRGSLVARN